MRLQTTLDLGAYMLNHHLLRTIGKLCICINEFVKDSIIRILSVGGANVRKQARSLSKHPEIGAPADFSPQLKEKLWRTLSL